MRAAADPRLAAWLDALLSTPGLTAIRDRDAAYQQHVADSLAAVDVLGPYDGPIVDVGSGGGAPGLPLAAAFPEREVTLLEAGARKCDFLRRTAAAFPNVRVVRGRAEEQPLERWVSAVAKALAEPHVAVEWCLPLVCVGGAVVLYTAAAAAADRVSSVAQAVGGDAAKIVSVSETRSLLLVSKVAPTPPGFPRRTGAARKRPLA